MFMALLFDEQDQLIAAAPACDQLALGDRYWSEVYPQEVSGVYGQTAVLDIQSTELVQLLQDLSKDSSLLGLCRKRFHEYEANQLASTTAHSFPRIIKKSA